MPPAWLVLAGVVFGVLLGAAAALSIVAARREGRGALAGVPPRVPPNVVAVLGALDAASVIVDASGRAVWTSGGAESMGIVRNGRCTAPELRALLARATRRGDAVREELTLAHADARGSGVEVVASAVRLRNDLVVLIVDDQSDARRIEEVRRDFIANISHELKTPIGAISLLAEAIDAAADEPDAVRRFTVRLSNEADRLTRLTQEIIELSRLQSGDPFRGAAPVPVATAIAQALDRVRVAVHTRRIELAVGELDPGATVIGDADQLATVVHNLVENAIQFTPDGGRIGIDVTVVGAAVELAVSDTGAGISEQDQARVFERFYRGDAARSRDTGGTGLGLAIVKHIVQNHGGEVTLRSTLGEGTTFTVRLPLADAPSSNTPAREEATSR